MKYKKGLMNLMGRQKVWTSYGSKYQASHKKPGSEK